MRYDPGSFKALTFHDVVPHFTTGKDTPRAYLERCLAQIATREPIVKAFAVVNEAFARAAADASSARWNAGQPLSAIDGMPMAVDMPTDNDGAASRRIDTRRDAAAVWALREAGAVILGKTITAAPAGAHSGPTTHPFDVMHAPGGSSAGSAAAVAARMCPAALVTRACGGVIRSASSCANFALELTQGAFNRGERQTGRKGTTGVLAGSIEDLWQVAIAIAQRVGGDPGHAGPCGPDLAPDAMSPRCLIVIESAARRAADEATRTAFEALLDQIGCSGVTLMRRRDHPAIEAFEQAVVRAGEVVLDITRCGSRRASRSARALAEQGHVALAPLADAIVMLSAPGPAPVWAGDPPCNLLHAPAVSLPLMSVNGMPVGAQLMGQRDEDARVVALARWVAREAGTVVV
jgi:Asp-tRNA(Asn)/Glu-tRNA(Gln) amidotransferase A subunit family amidase